MCLSAVKIATNRRVHWKNVAVTAIAAKAFIAVRTNSTKMKKRKTEEGKKCANDERKRKNALAFGVESLSLLSVDSHTRTPITPIYDTLNVRRRTAGR